MEGHNSEESEVGWHFVLVLVLFDKEYRNIKF